MSTVFGFLPGETEKQSKVRFGFKSWFGRLDAQICARIVHLDDHPAILNRS
jgi:hypothetical protein